MPSGISSTRARRIRHKKLKDQFGLCFYCYRKINMQCATLDHLHPKSMGGSWCVDNLVVACQWCNSKRGTMHPDQFATKLRSGELEPGPTDLFHVNAKKKGKSHHA